MFSDAERGINMRFFRKRMKQLYGTNLLIMIKKVILSVLVSFIIVICYLSFVGIKQEISQEFSAIEFDDISHIELNKTTVKIEGILTKKTFLEDEFNGRIEINNNELTKKEPMFVKLVEENNGYLGIISVHLDEQSSIPHLLPVGVITFYTPKDFSKIAFSIVNASNVIVGPAKTLEEAKVLQTDILRLLREEYE